MFANYVVLVILLYFCVFFLLISQLSNIFQAEEERLNRIKQQEHEERVAKELSRINFEKQREEKMKQQVIENR